jgi:hypothetical protein
VTRVKGWLGSVSTYMLMDETTTIRGVKIYDKLVGDSIVGSLTPDLRGRVKQLDEETQGTVSDYATKIPW